MSKVNTMKVRRSFKTTDENGNEVKRGEVGEIYARGPNIMLGYWQQEGLTKQAISEDGWMKTGDGAKMDEDGYVFIVDRVKDMIISAFDKQVYF